jgi:hypothetical protein
MLQQMFLASQKEEIAPLPHIRFLIRLGLEDTAARLNSVKSDLATQFLDINFSRANLDDRFLRSC